MDSTTIRLAAQLDLPHHLGAGGEDDFIDKETYDKHMKRVENRERKTLKRKSFRKTPKENPQGKFLHGNP